MASRSSSYDEPDSVNQSPHKWTTWEVRALICLIIKGEHRVYDDPAYFTDKLNSALNPSPSVTNKSNGSSNGETDAPMRPSRSQQDIPHRDVQAMLKRILTKKKHAVEISQRDHTYNVTRKKMAAFMRNIDFDGSPEEWEAGRREKVLADGVKKQNKKRITGRREKEERKRRKAMIRSPRAKNLLINWGIGASFWEDDDNDNHRQSRRRSGTQQPTTPSPTRSNPSSTPNSTKIASANTRTPSNASKDDKPFVIHDNHGNIVPTTTTTGLTPGAWTPGPMDYSATNTPATGVPVTPATPSLGEWMSSFGPVAPIGLPLLKTTASGYGGGHGTANKPQSSHHPVSEQGADIF